MADQSEISNRVAAILQRHGIPAEENNRLIALFDYNPLFDDAVPALRRDIKAYESQAVQLRRMSESLNHPGFGAACRRAGTTREKLVAAFTTEARIVEAHARVTHSIKHFLGVGDRGPIRNLKRDHAIWNLATLWNVHRGVPAANYDVTRGDRRTEFVLFVEAVFEATGNLPVFSEQAVSDALAQWEKPARD